MNEMINTDSDIDYEHMDDLPLSDHIEWKYFQVEQMISTTLDEEFDQWQTLTT